MDWIERRGFGDRPLVGERPFDAGEATKPRLRVPLDGPEPDRCEDPGPLWTAIGAGALVAAGVTAWFLVLALLHPASWSAAEVTAPLWGTALAGGVAALVLGVVCGILDAWDAHQRKGRRA